VRHVTVSEVIVVVDREVDVVYGNAVDIGLIELSSMRVVTEGGVIDMIVEETNASKRELSFR
jgi:hypothetical protein